MVRRAFIASIVCRRHVSWPRCRSRRPSRSPPRRLPDQAQRPTELSIDRSTNGGISPEARRAGLPVVSDPALTRTPRRRRRRAVGRPRLRARVLHDPAQDRSRCPVAAAPDSLPYRSVARAGRGRSCSRAVTDDGPPEFESNCGSISVQGATRRAQAFRRGLRATARCGIRATARTAIADDFHKKTRGLDGVARTGWRSRRTATARA